MDCYLRCDRSKEMGGRDLDTTLRRNTKRKGCGCRFLIKVVERRARDGWVIVCDKGHGQHNHRLTVYPEGHRQISGLSTGAKQIVRDMTEAQAKPRNILKAVKEKFPEDNPNQRHIYNFREYMRRTKSEDRNPVQQFLHQAVQCQYLHWIMADEETNVVTRAFLAHPTSVQLLRTYPFVICMDSTYKTNKYKMPLFEMIGVTPTNMNFLIGYAILMDESYPSYLWVLEKLRDLLLGFFLTLLIYSARGTSTKTYLTTHITYSGRISRWQRRSGVEDGRESCFLLQKQSMIGLCIL